MQSLEFLKSIRQIWLSKHKTHETHYKEVCNRTNWKYEKKNKLAWARHSTGFILKDVCTTILVARNECFSSQLWSRYCCCDLVIVAVIWRQLFTSTIELDAPLTNSLKITRHLVNKEVRRRRKNKQGWKGIIVYLSASLLKEMLSSWRHHKSQVIKQHFFCVCTSCSPFDF